MAEQQKYKTSNFTEGGDIASCSRWLQQLDNQV